MESLEFGYSGGYCSGKVSCAGCQLSCLWLWPVTEDVLPPGWSASCCSFIPADSQWLTLTPALAHFAHSRHPLCPLLFLLFYVCLLITLLRGPEKRERLLIVFAALCLLCSFSCSPDSAKLAEVKRVTTDRTRWIKCSLWMACWLLVQLELTPCYSWSWRSKGLLYGNKCAQVTSKDVQYMTQGKRHSACL